MPVAFTARGQLNWLLRALSRCALLLYACDEVSKDKDDVIIT